MPQVARLRIQLIKALVYPLLSLFLLPVLAQLFVHDALPEINDAVLSSVETAIDNSSTWSDADKQQAKLLNLGTQPSEVCLGRDELPAAYREGVCERFSTLWQFSVVERATFWLLLLGAGILLFVLQLGVVAFSNRQARYRSFTAGWRLLVLTSALEVIAQGVLLVWLSYWVTAYYFEIYYPKLVVLSGVLVGVAVYLMVSGIFRRAPTHTEVEGELLTPEAAPAFWAHVKQLAARLKTRAPDQIVAGIDANFFVTEAPLTVHGQAVHGRTLYVSLPLLGILERGEADAVLAHELAHLEGGDTANSAKLGPKLVQYDHYCQMMAAVGATKPIFHLMQLYRVIFEFALKKESRAREFLADRLAASLVSARGIVHSLIKIAAYAGYRAKIERTLFAHGQRHPDALGIAGFVSEGLASYAGSDEFVAEIRSASLAHPFDTHPPLSERMANVVHVANKKDMPGIAARRPTESWLADMPTAPEIEQRLWAAYERQFAAAHEHDLAYRYEPANETQRAIVLKHFPPTAFALKGNQRIEINHVGLLLPERADVLAWDDVGKVSYENGFGGDVLRIGHPKKGWLGSKSTKVKLYGIGKERERFKQTLGRYWQRHQYMRRQQAATSGG